MSKDKKIGEVKLLEQRSYILEAEMIGDMWNKINEALIVLNELTKTINKDT